MLSDSSGEYQGYLLLGSNNKGLAEGHAFVMILL